MPGAARAPPTDPVGRYRAIHAASLAEGLPFFERLGREELRWRTPFARTLDWEPPFARWYPDGTLNAAENCLDRHLDSATADRVAFHWEGEDGARRSVTYRALHAEVVRLASALAERGFGPTDYAGIYLPMIPELPVAMLACARLGIPFTVVFSGFSATALGDRLADLGARLLITADGGWRRGKIVPLKAVADAALDRAPSVRTVVVARRTGEPVPMRTGRDVAWTELPPAPVSIAPPAAFASTHPLFLLYSSGTTGKPKAIVHGTGGYLAWVRATMRWVFDPRASETYWCAADVGWVTGHSYIVFGPLLNGLTSVLYEGALDYPASDRLWALVERYRVNVLYTSPTALRAQRKYGDAPVRAHDLRSLRLLGTVGEAINPSVATWYADVVGGGRCPVVDTWWQTETGGILVSAAAGLGLVPPRPGSATFPLPGIDAEVVDEHGEPTADGERGFLVVRRPWPGMLLGLLGEDDRYRSTYWTRFPGAYYPGDYALRDADGYLWFLGRADEVLKVAGHRLGTIELEDALLTHPCVAEAAVCGAADPEKGEVPVAFVVVRTGVERTASLPDELADHVAREIGKFARPATVHVVGALPKTRSGKILRRVVKSVAERREDVGDVTTLEDGSSVEELQRAFEGLRREVDPPR